jgi:hypothetical protein
MSARMTLETWREQRADRLDPLRFHFIEAMERRAAASQNGEVRRVLDDKLSRLLAAYADDLQGAASTAESVAEAPPQQDSAGALGGLVRQFANGTLARGEDADADGAVLPTSALPELEMLDEFRNIWSTLRTEGQLRRSLQQMPVNAGPLNSSALVHRAIALMRDLSPGYLGQFLAYVDVLSCMEQINNGAAAPAKDTLAATGARKQARVGRKRQ